MSHTEGRLFHPNIVQVHRTGKANGFFTIAMEYVEGITLYQKICEEERIELKEALSITKVVVTNLIRPMTTEPTTPKKPRRRWLQFSLKTLLLLVVVLCALPAAASVLEELRRTLA